MPSGNSQKQAKILCKGKCYPVYQSSPLNNLLYNDLNNLLYNDQHIEENQAHKETRHP